MSDHWDDIVKHLLRQNPQQFVSWLVEDAQFVRELLALSYTLTGLIYKDTPEMKLMERKFAMLGDSILEQSWTYQKIKAKGLEEGRKQDLEEGREEGRREGHQEAVEALRKVLISAVQTRFPELIFLALEKTGEVNDLIALQGTTLKVHAAKNAEEAKQTLLEIEVFRNGK